MPTLIRELTYEDCEGVNKLYATQNWAPASKAGWQRLAEKNPACTHSSTPIGWAVENQGEIVGALTNIRQMYHFRGKQILAAAAGSLVVRPDFGVYSLKLLNHFRQQDHVDVFFTNTAAPTTTKLLKFLKFRELPQTDFGDDLVFVLNATQFAQAVAKKKYPKLPIVRIISAAPSPLLSLGLKAVGHRSKFPDRPPTDLEIKELLFSDDMENIWKQRLKVSDRFLAARDVKTLKWHFLDGDRPGFRMIGVWRKNSLVGYSIFFKRHRQHLGITSAKLADFYVSEGAPETTRHLFNETLKVAKKDGAAMLEVEGFDHSLRSEATKLKPFHNPRDIPPFWFWSHQTELMEQLTQEGVWFAGPYDGDGSL